MPKKLSVTGKIFFGGLLALVLIVIGLGIWLWQGDNIVDSFNKIKVEDVNGDDKPTENFVESKIPPIKISLDEWIGWKSLIDANGGLKTQKGSINDKLGLNIEYIVNNDGKSSSQAIIKGDLVGGGYTVNRYAFLYNQFKASNVPVKMVYITNYSNGGDGIIAKANIKSINDLVGIKIGIPAFSEAQTLVEWLLNNSDLTVEEKNQIRSDYVFFETPDDAAKAFFAGRVDAAATWEPYLTQAKDSTESRVLFSTLQSTNLIMDGLVFRQDWLEQNADTVRKIINGSLQAASMYDSVFSNIKVFPLFADETNQSIKDMSESAKLATWRDNSHLLIDEAVQMFKDMSSIWLSVGELADPSNANSAFDIQYINALSAQYINEEPLVEEKPVFKEETKIVVAEQSNDEALLKRSLSISFLPDSTVITEDSYPALDEFVSIAKSLNGVYIQIEGNAADLNDATIEDIKAGKVEVVSIKFSEQRAQSVAAYLEAKGIDPSRIIVKGNGNQNPVADNTTPEGMQANRRTDIYFKSGQ